MARSSTSGQGRPKGLPNLATREVRALAHSFGPDAIMMLAELAGLLRDEAGNRIGNPAKLEATRVAAAKELLDRAYGKARQPISGPDEGDDAQPLTVVYRWMSAAEVPVIAGDE